MNSLVFSVSDNNILDPLELTTTATVSVTNTGATDLEGLGVWITPSVFTGGVDYPIAANPGRDYQTVLKWGTDTYDEVTVSGGIELTLPQNAGPDIASYITRTAGSLRENKLAIKDIPSGDTIEFVVSLEVPFGASTSRLYIDLHVG